MSELPLVLLVGSAGWDCEDDADAEVRSRSQRPIPTPTAAARVGRMCAIDPIPAIDGSNIAEPPCSGARLQHVDAAVHRADRQSGRREPPFPHHGACVITTSQ